MSLEEFQIQYLQQQPFLWLALAAALGLLIGLVIGRRSAGPRTPKTEETGDSSLPAEAAAPLADEEIITDQPAADAEGTDLALISGIADKHTTKLKALGITTVEQLIDRTSDRQKREALADELQLEDFVINKWTRTASFMQLPGMTPETAEFLVFAGINSVADLASRNPESVHHKLLHFNEQEQRIKNVPSRQELEAWIASVND